MFFEMERVICVNNRKGFRQAILLTFLVTQSWSVYADHPANSELKVKVALVYKLAKFVEWPELINKKKDFNICLIGSDPFGSIVDALQERKMGGQKIHVRRISLSSANYDDCQIAYINIPDTKRLISVTRQLQTRPVLTISDHPQFVELGGIIQLVNLNDRVAFNINHDSSVRAGLSIAAPLLEIAKVVKKSARLNSK